MILRPFHQADRAPLAARPIALSLLLSLSLLAGCGKKPEAAAGLASSAPPAPAETPPPLYKPTEKFGTVSAVVLEGSAPLPARFGAYQRQEATEWLKDEYRQQPASAFEAYLKRWQTQAASVAQPDWTLLTKIVHPETVDETNAFKMQDRIEKTRQEVPADKASLQMVMAYRAEYVSLAGPDLATGEYYLSLRPGASRMGVSYSDGRYRSDLNYVPDFEALCAGCRDLQFTVRLPLQRAREIEALREKGKDMMRIYGRVTGFHEPATAVIRRDGAAADLTVEVEAIEMGSRQNGVYTSYFVLGPEQLEVWKARNH